MQIYFTNIVKSTKDKIFFRASISSSTNRIGFSGIKNFLKWAKHGVSTKQIMIEGFRFFRHSRSLVGDRIRWVCCKKQKLKCRVSAITIAGELVSTTGEHCHDWVAFYCIGRFFYTGWYVIFCELKELTFILLKLSFRISWFLLDLVYKDLILVSSLGKWVFWNYYALFVFHALSSNFSQHFFYRW